MPCQCWSLPDAELRLWPAFIDADESTRLRHRWLSQLAWQQPQIRLYGRAVAIPRMQLWMGDADAHYRYSATLFQPEPWRPDVHQLAERISKVAGQAFNSVLLNLYRDGQDAMGWHSDDEPELGREPLIASLSLGASRRFQLAHRHQPYKLEIVLNDGDLLVMSGPTQHHWRHAIPRQANCHQARINLTFRRIMPHPGSAGGQLNQQEQP